MLQSIKGGISFDFDKCQQCGTCEAVCPTHSITYELRKDGLSDIVIDRSSCISCNKCVQSCPAAMRSDFSKYNNKLKDKSFYFAYNSDNSIRHKSSSGGAARTLIIESLKSRIVDGVYTLRNCPEYPFVEGHLYTQSDIPTYDEIPNSVYHSTMLGRNCKAIGKCNRLMIVGTTCQLKALKVALKGKYNELITICIFCKQQKTLQSTRFLAKAMGCKLAMESFSFQYRGSGWPGIVKINDCTLPYHRAAQLPFGRRLWSVAGCNICGDPMGLEADADLSLMDPWEIRKHNDLGETLVTVNSNKGLDILSTTHNLIVEQKAYEDILPALGLADIHRKQQLVPYYRGDACSATIKRAGKMEQLQRKWLQNVATTLPRMPFIVYRLMCKLPDFRNLILK